MSLQFLCGLGGILAFSSWNMPNRHALFPGTRRFMQIHARERCDRGQQFFGWRLYGDGLFSLPQVEFAIKHYAQGAFTSQLAVLPVGTPVLKSNRFLVLQ